MITNGLMSGLSTTMLVIYLAVMALSAFTLVNAAIHREDAYRAAGKMTKQGWIIILSVVLAIDFLAPGFLSIIGVAVAIVYLVDVRPALKQVSGKGNGGGKNNGQHMGPYGPW